MSGSSQLLSAAFETLLMGVDDISQSGGGAAGGGGRGHFKCFLYCKVLPFVFALKRKTLSFSKGKGSKWRAEGKGGALKQSVERCERVRRTSEADSEEVYSLLRCGSLTPAPTLRHQSGTRVSSNSKHVMMSAGAAEPNIRPADGYLA